MEEKDGLKRCQNPDCLALYDNGLDLEDPKLRQFKDLLVGSKMAPPKGSVFRIPRPIELDTMERDIADFIGAAPAGRFLVTWPGIGGHPRFIPLALSDFLARNQGKKAVMIYCASDKTAVDSWATLCGLCRCNPNSFPSVDTVGAGKKAANKKVVESQLVNATTVVHIELFARNGSMAPWQSKFVADSHEKCAIAVRNVVEEEIQNSGLTENDPSLLKSARLAVEQARKICQRETKKQEQFHGEVRIGSTESEDEYRIGFEVRPHRPSLRLNIDRMVEFAFSDSQKITEMTKAVRLGDPRTRFGGANLLLIPDSLDDPLIGAAEFKPDILVIQSGDEWLRGQSMRGMDRDILPNFLKRSTIPSILIFSSSRETRHLYQIGMDGGRFSDPGMTIISMDHERIIEDYYFGIPKAEARNGPFSCSQRRARAARMKMEIERRPIDELEKLQDFIDSFNGNDLAKGDRERLVSLLWTLIRAPLSLKPSELPMEMQSRGIDLGFEMQALIDKIVMAGCEDIASDLRSVLRECFGERLLEVPFIKAILDIIIDEEPEALVVVAGQQWHELEMVLRSQNRTDKSPMELSVTSWGSLEAKTKKLPPNLRPIIIALVPDYHAQFRIGERAYSKVILLGSQTQTLLIEETLSTRYSDQGQTPIAIFDEESTLPRRYREIRKSSEVVPTDYSIWATEYWRHRMSAGLRVNSRGDEDLPKISSIKAGGDGYLALDDHGQAVLLSLDSRLLLESEGWWWDRLDLEKDPSKLKGRRLILNEQELKNELKIRFSKAIYPEGNALRVNYGTYSWSSFAGLHDDSNIWRDDIHRCILSLMSIKGLKREEAEKEFITRILGDDRMGVKTEQTVRNWLSSPIDEEVCRVFRTYRTELKSNQELYRVMADISPGEQFDRMKGRRSYYAAMCLERLREQISRGEIPRSLKEHQIQIREVFRQLPIDSIHIMRIIRGRLVKQTDVMRCRDQMSYDDVFERIREV